MMDIGADGRHGGVHCRVLRGFESQQRFQALGEVGLGR
jgi:hypothetical protein